MTEDSKPNIEETLNTVRSTGTMIDSVRSQDTIINPPSQGYESISDFEDGDYGEPLVPQHLVIDFTPDDEIDNEIAQKKCCDFWDYVNSREDLKELIVLPQPEHFENPSSSDQSDQNSAQESTIESIPIGKTAVSMLEFIAEKRLTNSAFEAKMPKSNCSLEDRDYIENAPQEFKHHCNKKHVCACPSLCRKKRRFKQSTEAMPTSTEFLQMYKTMREWDEEHPKSMEPPGHSPSLNSVMQRKPSNC